MTNFLAELKKRNVFKVATIYVVVSWLLLQVATVVLPVFEIPMWASRLVVILLGLGFPIALILAWAFDLTPDGIEWNSTTGVHHVHTHVWDWVLGILLVVAIGLIVSSEIRHWNEADLATTAGLGADTIPGEVATAGKDNLSIAVLPFVNMSGDPQNEYFSDGMSEEILNLLARIPGLKVIGRTSTFAFKGKNEDLRAIGKTLGAATLLEGSVRKSGDRLRITAQLIDATDGTHIWSETYDRTLTDVFAVQDDVAASIINALQIHVGVAPSRGRPTDDTEAYALFLKASIAASNYDWPGVVSLATRAVELDPAFAEAYELLADSYWRMGGGLMAADEAQERMRASASAALSHNPDLVLAKALYGIGDPEHYSRLAEIEAFEQAAAAQPDNPRVLDSLFFNLFVTGYLEEAMQIAGRLVEIDPLSPVANGRMPTALFAVGRTEAGFAALDIFDQLDQERTHWFVGDTNLAYKRYETAIRSFEATLSQAGQSDTGWVSDLVNAARRPDSGLASLERRIPEIADSVPEDFEVNLRGELQAWYLYFGFVDRYFELIMAHELRKDTWGNVDDLLATGMAYPPLGFVEHPKYLDVAHSLGFVDVWEARGAPDFCRKSNGAWTCGQQQ